MKNQINKFSLYINKIKENKFWKNLIKNSFWAFFGDSFASVITLIVSIVLIKLIGNTNYGILILGQSYMQIMDALLNVQCWKSVIQYGQKAIVNNDIDCLYGYVKLGTILDLSTAIIGGIVALLLVGVIGRLFHWSSEFIDCARIFSLTIFSHFSGTTTAILRILNKFNLVALQKSISAILKLVALLLILFFYDEIALKFAVIVYSVTDIIGNFILVVFAMITFNKKYNVKNIFTSKLPKDKTEFIKFTIWGTISEVVDIPVNYFDVFIVSYLGTNLVAVFKVFKQIVSIISKVTTPIYQAIMPQFSELFAKGRKKEGYAVVKRIRNLILLIMIPFSLIVGSTSVYWLKQIYGNLYAKNWYILLIYLLVKTFALSYTTIHPYFITLGNAKESAIYVLIANIIYITLAILLTKQFGMISLVLAFFVQSTIVISLKINHIKKKGGFSET